MQETVTITLDRYEEMKERINKLEEENQSFKKLFQVKETPKHTEVRFSIPSVADWAEKEFTRFDFPFYFKSQKPVHVLYTFAYK